jgi:hypothetical protein
MKLRFRLSAAVLPCVLLAALLLASAAVAGTQDFTLINQTGVDVFELFISESRSDEWEEDVLGENVLLDGERIDITFRGRRACMWDMLANDEAGDGIAFQAINLCETSVVVLRCNEEECWAEYE